MTQTISDSLEANPERALMLIPVGSEHLEAPYLGSATYMTAYTRTDVVIADTYKADSVGSIFRQTAGINLLR